MTTHTCNLWIWEPEGGKSFKIKLDYNAKLVFKLMRKYTQCQLLIYLFHFFHHVFLLVKLSKYSGSIKPNAYVIIPPHGTFREPRAETHFVLLLSMYLVSVLGNQLIILAISSNSHLHIPCTSSLLMCFWLTLT